jgi:hypothetical protein
MKSLVIKSMSRILQGRRGTPNEYCPICCEPAMAVPYCGSVGICLEDTYEIVCRNCCNEYDPGLLAWMCKLEYWTHR